MPFGEYVRGSCRCDHEYKKVCIRLITPLSHGSQAFRTSTLPK